jgi:hypothetical protein
MRRLAVGLALAALLATAVPTLAEARTCPCAYPVKRIYKPARLGLRVVINPVYPFYPYLRSSWRLYWGYPRSYYVYRTYRPARLVRQTIVAPPIAEPLIDK